MKSSALSLSVALIATLISAPAAAESEPESEPAPATEVAAEEPAGFGVEVGIGLYSAYVWRGWNIFQSDGQMDQHGMAAPSVTVSLPIEGLTIGYWGAYQLNGDNRSENADAALDFEQDLILGYERSFSDKLSGAFAFIYYFYPLADETVAGTSWPSIVEPSASVNYAAGVADVGLAVAYFYGVQDAVEPLRHIYINPSVARSFPIKGDLALDAKLGFGYKVWDDSAIKDNVYDVLVSVGMAYPVTSELTVTPALNAAWTNITEEGFGFADEYVIWAGVDLGLPVL